MVESKELISELRGALGHLSDLTYLESCPLAKRVQFIAQLPDVSRGQVLRRTLLLAIEALDPGPGSPPNSPEARPYQILKRYYVSKQTMTKISAGLDITERHAYRELRRGTEALAQILSDSELDAGPAGSLEEKASSRAAKVREEVERLSGLNAQQMDLVEVITSAIESAQCLARKRGFEIRLQAETPGLQVATNRVMLRQAILNLLSHIVSVHQGDSLLVRLYRAAGDALVECTYRPPARPDRLDPEEPYRVAAELLDSLGIRWAREDAPTGMIRVMLRISLVREHTLLIVDDNPGLIRLFKRFLRHQPYAIYDAPDGAMALEMLERVRPEVVILDVMMAERDGWEILQTLRANGVDRNKTRVIVCSIINDPQLASALGADAFLHKPVDRTSLLQALGRVLSPTT